VVDGFEKAGPVEVLEDSRFVAVFLAFAKA
jgi:hypothetical protein